MPIINEYDALTGENVSKEVTDAEFSAILGEVTITKPFGELVAEGEAVKVSAIAKLAALGLTEDEAKAIIG